MKHKKTTILAVSLLAAVFAVSGITLAFLTDSTEEIVNTFTPTSVPIDVVENFENNVKSNVKIQNDGDIPAYIRAAIVVNWVDGQGNVLGTPPVEGEGNDYSLTLNLTEDWIKNDDGYYYWTSPVSAGEETGVLITECKALNEAPLDGYNLQVEILAQSVQSVPEEAIEDLWGVTIEDGRVTTVKED